MDIVGLKEILHLASVLGILSTDRILDQHKHKNTEPHFHTKHEKGLILSRNVIIGYQISYLLSSKCGWHVHIVHNDKDAYEYINKKLVNNVVADIDTNDLGGLAFLVYTNINWPSVNTYAITGNFDPYILRLAKDMGGCEGFFYLSNNKMSIDTTSGMAVELPKKCNH